MGKVNVIIVDATGNKEQKVGLPDDIKCGVIMVKLIEKIKLPSVGPDKVTGKQLLEAQTLADAGIKDGDVLRLQPEITAGAVCSRCGSYENDGIAFCSKCGNPMANTQPEPQPQAPVYTGYTPAPAAPAAPAFNPSAVVKKKGKLPCILGMVSGALSVIFGLVMTGMSIGYWESAKSYGGDAYTGIQNAAAQTANNVQDLADIAMNGFAYLLIVLGLFMICNFLYKLQTLPESK